jgi:hypothetical protein
VAQAISAEAEPTGELGESSNSEAITITTPRTVAELEAEIAREMEVPVPEVKRARVIKNQLVAQGQREPEMLAMTIRGWLQETSKQDL